MAQPVIKRRGQLTETSPEEVSKLSMAINRPMAPTTPMETGAIGGTPAQAKMAGTPAQTRATLRAEITEKDDLSTRLRQRQPRRQATAEEQAQIEEGRRLEQLRGLGGRVQQLAEQAVIPEETAEAELDVAEEVDPDTAALVRAVQENPEDQQALINLSNKLAEQGKIPAGQVASTEQISQLFGDKQQAISRALGEAVPEEIVLTDADYQELGFADSGELASLLGVPAEQLAGMDVQQLTEQINAELTDEFDKVEDLTRKANDPYLGPAERAAVRSELRDLGAVGIRTLESDIDTLADQIE